MTVKIINKITNESWLCDNVNDVVTIDEQKFIWVYRKEKPDLKLMMNTESVSVLLISENASADRPQLNG